VTPLVWRRHLLLRAETAGGTAEHDVLSRNGVVLSSQAVTYDDEQVTEQQRRCAEDLNS